MKQSAIGLNIHVGYVQNWGGLLSRLDQLQPLVNLCHIDNPDQMGRVRELQQRYPQTQLIVRMYTENPKEGDYHLAGDQQGYRMAPGEFVRQYAELGRGGLILNAQNEPSGYEQLDRLTAWHGAALVAADQLEVRLAGPAFGMGHPALGSPDDNEWTSALVPLLKGYGYRRAAHWLNLHEYALRDREPNNYHMGRFRRMAALCERLKIAMPNVVVTEWGVDRGGQGSGYKGQGLDGPGYADWLVDAYAIYRLWVNTGVIKGLCIFCYGNSGGWETFDVEPDGDFWTRFLGRVPRVDRAEPTPSPEPQPTPTPEPEPTPSPEPEPEPPAPEPAPGNGVLIRAEIDKIIAALTVIRDAL